MEAKSVVTGYDTVRPAEYRVDKAEPLDDSRAESELGDRISTLLTGWLRRSPLTVLRSGILNGD